MCFFEVGFSFLVYVLTSEIIIGKTSKLFVICVHLMFSSSDIVSEEKSLTGVNASE